jgi:hypothetical protein
MDARGRVADRMIMRALNWQPGDRLNVRLSDGLIIVKMGAGGPRHPCPYTGTMVGTCLRSCSARVRAESGPADAAPNPQANLCCSGRRAGNRRINRALPMKSLLIGSINADEANG